MAIKKLQQNFTTIAQSNRLLELGLPADSADCYHNRIAEKPFILSMPYSYSNWDDKDNPPLPCWSAGRLIEIFTICAEYHTGDNSLVFNKESVLLGNINCLIPVIELAVKDKCIDFSKLEDCVWNGLFFY